MSEDFLPKDYKIPASTSNYMRFQEGLNRIRILSSAVVGFEYFNTSDKPVRSKTPFDGEPRDIKKDGKVKAFWAFVIWNYQTKQIQILELTQKGIMNDILSLKNNPKWGMPTKYDIAITRTGEGLETKYSTQGEPPIEEADAKILAKYKTTIVNLNALFEGTDPFAVKKVSIDDIAL